MQPDLNSHIWIGASTTLSDASVNNRKYKQERAARVLCVDRVQQNKRLSDKHAQCVQSMSCGRWRGRSKSTFAVNGVRCRARARACVRAWRHRQNVTSHCGGINFGNTSVFLHAFINTSQGCMRFRRFFFTLMWTGDRKRTSVDVDLRVLDPVR